MSIDRQCRFALLVCISFGLASCNSAAPPSDGGDADLGSGDIRTGGGGNTTGGGGDTAISNPDKLPGVWRKCDSSGNVHKDNQILTFKASGGYTLTRYPSALVSSSYLDESGTYATSGDTIRFLPSSVRVSDNGLTWTDGLVRGYDCRYRTVDSLLALEIDGSTLYYLH